MANDLTGEVVLNLGDDAPAEPAFVAGTADPVIAPQPYSQPADFAAQYPTPLDPTEILVMCEEVNVLQAIPEEGTALSAYTWREMNSLAFTSGSAYLAFADGVCPYPRRQGIKHDASSIMGLALDSSGVI